MSWISEEIRTSIASALEDYADLAAVPVDVRVDEVLGDGPERLRVRVRAGSAEAEGDLPLALASAYLADEEAAVDEFKRWMRDLFSQLGR
jgi:hypothetical protein